MPENKEKPVDAIDVYRLTQTAEKWTKARLAIVDRACETPEQKAWWQDRLGLGLSALKELEAERVEMKAPLLEATRKLDAEYKKSTTPIQEFVDFVKARIGAYDLAVAEESRRLLAAAREAAEAGDGETALALAQAAPEATKGGGSSTTFTWEVSSCNVLEAPRAFLKLDEAAVKAYLKTLPAGAEPKLEGFTFERVASVRGTGKRKP